MPCPPSHPNPVEAGKEMAEEAVHSLVRIGSKKQKKKRKSMRYPFDDPEAVMICSREREREREEERK
jgi:hypothetical protein